MASEPEYQCTTHPELPVFEIVGETHRHPSRQWFSVVCDSPLEIVDVCQTDQQPETRCDYE